MAESGSTFPARYMLQRKDGDLYVKIGNGCNQLDPLFGRKRRLEKQAARAVSNGPVPTFRVWDTRNGVEVAAS